ncbi:MAG: putative transporter [Phycisphaeraceae bacterium JB051]
MFLASANESILNAVFSLFPQGSVALTVMAISVVGVTGLALGSIKLKAFSLGIPGTMFTGIIIGKWLGMDSFDASMLHFARDFGLILFVYAVGVQVGPGFVANLRKHGLPLNIMAAVIVLTGAAICVAYSYIIPNVVDINAATGLFAGATTNAPALGSAGEALKSVHETDIASQLLAYPTMPAFAIAYPFGLLGVIVAIVMLKAIFRVDTQIATEAIEKAEKAHAAELVTINIEVHNENLNGVLLRKLPLLKPKDPGMVISRIMHDGVVSIAKPDSSVYVGDTLLVVGNPDQIEQFRLAVGVESETDIRQASPNLKLAHLIVTHNGALGKTIEELGLKQLGIAVTRIARAGLEFTATDHMKLQFGDRVRIVGEPSGIDEAGTILGNSLKALNYSRLIPIFIGLALGVTLGCLSTTLGGALPGPCKLGVAAGPLIVAIILSRMGNIGPIIWHMPHNSSQLIREFGITLFTICVGIMAGDGFFQALNQSTGWYWLGLGAVVTLVPLLLVGAIAIKVFKINFLHVSGLLCGSMTSPSLAFTHTLTSSEAPAIAFATVYPLTMVMRVLLGQLLILIFH